MKSKYLTAFKKLLDNSDRYKVILCKEHHGDITPTMNVASHTGSEEYNAWDCDKCLFFPVPKWELLQSKDNEK